MKFGVLGWIVGALVDVDDDRVRWVADQGFQGTGAHLTVPARTISEDTVDQVRRAFANWNVELFQLWGPYPAIVSPDEDTRQQGVAAARDVVKLAARLGVPAAGVRPTSLSPRGDWWPHPQNHSRETEERFLRSLCEILETAEQLDVTVVLETHVTTVLNTPERIRSVIERTGSKRVRVNLDPVNFIGGITAAYDPTPVIHELFDQLGPFVETVHVKDFRLEDRFVVHIAETLPGTGMMDLATVVKRAYQNNPHGYLVVEHLPANLLPQARRNVAAVVEAAGIDLSA